MCWPGEGAVIALGVLEEGEAQADCEVGHLRRKGRRGRRAIEDEQEE